MSGMEEAVKLRSINDHWEMAEWQIKNAPDGHGFLMVVLCQFGDHYLAREGVAIISRLEPYVWPNSQQAWAAVERWRQEHQQ